MNRPTSFRDPLGLVCSANIGSEGPDTPCNPGNSGGGGGSGSFGGYGEFGLMGIPVTSGEGWIPWTPDSGVTVPFFPGMGTPLYYWGDIQVGTGLDLWSYGIDTGALEYWGYQGMRLLKALTPTVCGGGYFAGRGIEGEVGPVHGGAYALFTHDSLSGNSIGYLLEGGAGPISGGHESSVDLNTGRVDSTNLLFIGAGDHFGGLVGSSSNAIEVGGYAGAAGRFGGAYANITSANACPQ